jgi:hypothetical protein
MGDFIKNILDLKLSDNYEKDISLNINFKRTEVNIVFDQYDENELDIDTIINDLLWSTMPGDILTEANNNDIYSAQRINTELYLFKGEIIDTHTVQLKIIKKLTNEVLFIEEMFNVVNCINKDVFSELKIRNPKEIFQDYFKGIGFEFFSRKRIDELSDGDIITFRKENKNGYSELNIIYPNHNGWDQDCDFSSLYIHDETDLSWDSFFECMRTNIKNYDGYE